MTDAPLKPEQIRAQLLALCDEAERQAFGLRRKVPDMVNLIRTLCRDHAALHASAIQMDGNRNTGCLCAECVAERMAIRAGAAGYFVFMVQPDPETPGLMLTGCNPDHLERFTDMVQAAAKAFADSFTPPPEQKH